MESLKRADICVKPSIIHGLGVFAEEPIQTGNIIEQCHILLIPDYANVLGDYSFYIKDNTGHYALPLGYGALYNHSPTPNATFEVDEMKSILQIKAINTIPSGEEILVNYGPTWFSSRDSQPIQVTSKFRVRNFIYRHRRIVRSILFVLAIGLLVTMLQSA